MLDRPGLWLFSELEYQDTGDESPSNEEEEPADSLVGTL